MSTGRMRVSVKSSGSCSEGSESESESSSVRACWDMLDGKDEMDAGKWKWKWKW